MMYKLLPYVLRPDKRSQVPQYLIHFVTSKCNARCPHCFIFNEGDTRFSGSELTISEIEKFTLSLRGGIYNVNLTGGETFLRKDILEICELYLRNAKTKIVSKCLLRKLRIP